jgi:4'-phosphopantetheinyl transferase
MILWLVQSTADDADLARGNVPPGLLSPGEAARLAGLRTPKRQHDWLLGRWTAKQLVQRYVKQVTGTDIALPAIEIVNDGDGVPGVVLATTEGAAQGIEVGPGPLSLSISHCEEVALCALLVSTRGAPHREPGTGSSPPPAVGQPQVGADIERIRPRARSFVTDYFTPAEIDQVDGAAADLHDTLVTTVWSAKEAALKALHLGLTIDTRRVECRVTTAFPPPDSWQPLVVTYRPYAEGAGMPTGHALPGWWRTLGVYVLTLVVSEPTKTIPELI